MNKLTNRQVEVLDFIHNYKKANKYPPTMKEIASGLGIKNFTIVRDDINRLIKKKWMRKEKGIPRSLRIIKRLKNG